MSGCLARVILCVLVCVSVRMHARTSAHTHGRPEQFELVRLGRRVSQARDIFLAACCVVQVGRQRT